MTFHQNQKEFKEAIQAAAEYFGIREVLIEKDYWVSFVECAKSGKVICRKTFVLYPAFL